MEREEGEGASLQHPFKVFFLQAIFPIFSPTEQVHSLLICRTRAFLLCWDQWVGRGFSLSLCAAYILLFSHGAVTGRPIHHGTWSWTGTLWNSVNIRQVDAQMPDSLKTCESLFVFIFKVTGGKVHHQGFIQSKDWLLLTFIHFLSTAFLSVFIKGLSLHSESFSSL